MSKKTILIALLAGLSVLGLLWGFSFLAGSAPDNLPVLGARENIRLKTPGGDTGVVALIDTGAEFSSIDANLALSLGLRPDASRKKTIITELGTEERATLDLVFSLGGREITSLSTVADRSGLSTAMIIGRVDLKGFAVDASRSFLGGAGQDPGMGFEVVGAKERIKLESPSGEVELPATIDSGAEFSAVDGTFARSLGYVPDSQNKRTVVTGRGREERDTLPITFLLGSRKVSTVATVAERSSLSTKVLVGRADQKALLIDPSRQFIAAPGAPRSPFSGQFIAPPGAPQPPFLALSILDLPNVDFARIIIIIPMLGTVVVLLRLLAGIRTFGVFGPVVIGLTLLNLRILPGLVVYVILLVIGIAIKMLVLDRLRLAHISQFALIMFALVLAMFGITRLPFGAFFSFSDIFFPMIITSHLIEQASRSMEEHSMLDFVPVMAATLGTALVLAYYGAFLVNQPSPVLWSIFIGSIVAVIVAGNYLGLRLSELVRFKFLRKGHTHR